MLQIDMTLLGIGTCLNVLVVHAQPFIPHGRSLPSSKTNSFISAAGDEYTFCCACCGFFKVVNLLQ